MLASLLGVSTRVSRTPRPASRSPRVLSWTPLSGDQAHLQLYIVIGDADDTTLSLEFGDLKDFINARLFNEREVDRTAWALPSSVDPVAGPVNVRLLHAAGGN